MLIFALICALFATATAQVYPFPQPIQPFGFPQVGFPQPFLGGMGAGFASSGAGAGSFVSTSSNGVGLDSRFGGDDGGSVSTFVSSGPGGTIVSSNPGGTFVSPAGGFVSSSHGPGGSFVSTSHGVGLDSRFGGVAPIGGSGGSVSSFVSSGPGGTYVSGNPAGGSNFVSTSHGVSHGVGLGSRFGGGSSGVGTYVSSGPGGTVGGTHAYPHNTGGSVISSRFNDDDAGHGGAVGSSSFVSSSNVNGVSHQESVSSVNNNGHVTTYRQRQGNGK